MKVILPGRGGGQRSWKTIDRVAKGIWQNLRGSKKRNQSSLSNIFTRSGEHSLQCKMQRQIPKQRLIVKSPLMVSKSGPARPSGWGWKGGSKEEENSLSNILIWRALFFRKELLIVTSSLVSKILLWVGLAGCLAEDKREEAGSDWDQVSYSHWQNHH